MQHQVQRTIQILSDLTINQIAAGEVIENPSSVVKELVENSIDAGSTHITVETLAGGFQWIRLSDNGSGMSPEDAVLSLERHATSKMVNADDLFSLYTMGFRGEALASIASISKMTLLTSLDGERATCVNVEGGKISSVQASARAKGTTIEIHSLFYNVPARKKFQKSPASSSAEITKTMTHLALGHPRVGFTLIQHNRSVFSTIAGEELKERANALLSSDFVPSCKEFILNEPHCQATGLIADPTYARHNRSGQYLFINHRPVACPVISYAIKDAYGTRLSGDKHPVYLLHFSIPPHLIDVNVHPQKKEIRLRDETLLKYALHGAINTSLGGGTPSFSFPAAGSFFTEPTQEEEPVLLLREEETTPFEPSPSLPFETPLYLLGLYKDYALVDAQSLPLSFFPEKRNGIVFVDLKAAQKRVHFENLLKNAEASPISQGLLFPFSFSCSVAEADCLNTQLDLLKQIGLSVKQAGRGLFLIDAIPPFLDESEIQETLFDIVTSRADLKKMATLLSCRSSPRKGYTMEEARYLIGTLLKTTDPHHCPQGKPTVYYLKENDIENRFKTTLPQTD